MLRPAACPQKPQSKQEGPRPAKAGIVFNILGERLKTEALPPDVEAALVSWSGLRGDSPAMNAMKTVDVPKKQKAARQV